MLIEIKIRDYREFWIPTKPLVNFLLVISPPAQYVQHNYYTYIHQTVK